AGPPRVTVPGETVPVFLPGFGWSSPGDGSRRNRPRFFCRDLAGPPRVTVPGETVPVFLPGFGWSSPGDGFRRNRPRFFAGIWLVLPG
ncbi:MAG: hypothetical protein IJI41_05485, partial [Anaerolineaceae bacterium]|nr:hypothetical protein [Anaerolineaceae bacterium]